MHYFKLVFKVTTDIEFILYFIWIVAGPSQPDEDDYGYVSQEASAFYNKLMSKYNSLPPEKSIFAAASKKTVKDIASTKV